MTNLATNNKFYVTFTGNKTLSDNVIRVNIPGLSLDTIPQSNPFTPIKRSGKVAFSDLSIGINSDIAFTDYKFFFNWMLGLGFPESHAQYKKIKEERAKNGFVDLTTNIKVIIMNNSYNKQLELNFYDCWPNSLSDINLSLLDSSADPVQIDIGFAYDYFTIE